MTDEVRLGVAVMHLPVPERRHFLVDLQRRLDSREAAFVEVVRDPKAKGIWPTSRAAWSLAGKRGATHHLVISDDALVCRDFLAGLREAVRHRPEHAVSPYCGYGLISKAHARGDSWAVVDRGGVWGLCSVLPVAWVDEFLRWERRAFVQGQGKHQDDARLGTFLKETGRPAWQTVPTLAEHAGAGHSTVNHGGGGNLTSHSKCFLGAERSALEVDWSRGLEQPLRQNWSCPASLRWLIPEDQRR